MKLEKTENWKNQNSNKNQLTTSHFNKIQNADNDLAATNYRNSVRENIPIFKEKAHSNSGLFIVAERSTIVLRAEKKTIIKSSLPLKHKNQTKPSAHSWKKKTTVYQTRVFKLLTVQENHF